MARYSWNVNSLIRSLEKIDKLINRETDEVELARLLHSYDLVNSAIYSSFLRPSVEIPLNKIMPEKMSSFISNGRRYNLLIPYYNAITDNADLFDEVRDKKFAISDQLASATGAYVTKEQALNVCYQFYQDLDDEMFQHFKNFYDMRFNHLRFVKPKDAKDLDYSGIQHYLYGVNESFVEVVGNNNPDMTCTMIHEAAHVIDNSMNPDNYLSNDFYYEVISIFMQLVFYYKRAGGYDELFYYNSLVRYLNSYDRFAVDAYTYSDIMKAYGDNGYRLTKKFYDRVYDEHNMSKDDVFEFLNNFLFKDICYPISAAVALCFFNIYKKDEKKGIENLKRFIKTNNRDDYMPLILSDEFDEIVSGEVKDLLTESKECFERHAK